MTKLMKLVQAVDAMVSIASTGKALALALVLLAPSAQAAEVTCERAVLNSGDTTNLVEGFTYTPPVQQVNNGGAFYLNAGATLRGTNVTFKGHGVHAKPTANHGGAIYSTNGVISISGGYFLDNVSLAAGGGIVNYGGKLNISSVTFSNNEAPSKGGAISNDKKGSVAITNANFYGNHANNSCGGAIRNSSGTLDIFGCSFATNYLRNSTESGGAIDNCDVMNISGAIFEGNTAPKGGAIANTGTVNFNGVVTLVTTNDTVYNKGTLNWNLADGKAGRLNGYDKTSNNGTDAKLQLTVEDYQATTNFTLATGNFSDTAGKDAFSITNVAGGAALTGLTIDGAAVTSADKLTGYKLVTEEDLSVPTTNLVLQIVKYTCVRTELESGDSTNLVAGTTYTAAPTDKNGGVFVVKSGATLTGTNVKFEGNAARYGGAIDNAGTLSLDGVTFEGNKAKKVGGAIVTSSTVNFDGAVTLVTDSDTILNYGTLNWNLSGGKAGFLNGYQNITNDYSYVKYGCIPTLQLTVEDYATTTNFVIATGDFSSVEGKDAFSITNVLGGAAQTIKIGGIALVNGTWWSLAIEGGDKLVLKTAEMVTLSGVMTGVATNASSAVVSINGQTIEEKAGSYEVPKGCEVTVTYTAKDDYIFAAGAKTKTVTVGPLTENYAMTDADKPTAEAQWVEVREIAIDTRERIVVGSPNEVLPIAYSTNFWGEAAGGVGVEVWVTKPDETRSTLLRVNENGYAEWMPGSEEYGKYELGQKWINSDKSEVGSTNVTIIYSSPFPLTLATAEGGSVVAITNGLEATGTFNVLGFEKVTIAAKPAAHWQLKEMAATTNGVALVLDEAKTSLTNRFEMPCYGTVVTGSFVIAEIYRAELAQAATNSYVATTNAFNGMRLTDTELAQAIVDAKGALDSAIGVIAGATKPSEAKNAKDALDSTLENIKNAAQKLSDMKPWELVIASDFSANPPFENILTDEDGNVTNFTYAGRGYVPGISAYTSFTDAFTNETYGVFATNLHVFGAQTIASEPTMIAKWNLDLCDDTVVTVWATSTKDLVNITNELSQITGVGTIVLSKTADHVKPSIYDVFIADKDKVCVKNVAKEWFETVGGFSIVVDEGEVDPETGKFVVGGIETAGKEISLTLSEEATNDVLVAGSLVALANEISLWNESTNVMLVSGKIEAKSLYVSNDGRGTDTDGSIWLTKAIVSGDVNVENNAHLEADITAGGKIDIVNGNIQTLVGTYAGSAIVLQGEGSGAISNVTFLSDGPVKIWGVNVLTGPFTIDADAITNEGTLAWSVANDNKTATLANFDAIVQEGPDAKFKILIDGEQATNAFCGVYTLAKNAATAVGKSFTITGPNGFSKSVTVGGGTIYVGAMAFDLSLNAQKELVFTVSLGRFDVKSHTVTIGGTTASEGGTVTVTNEAIVGTDVAVKATPNANWQFNGWSGTNVTTGAKLVFADAAAFSTTFKMQAGKADVTATFALSEAYRAEQLTAVTNDAAATRLAIDTTETLSEAEKKALYAETDLALDTATNALVKAVHPDAVKSAADVATAAFEDIRDAAEGHAEGKARFASNEVIGVEGKEIKVVVYGGSKKGPSQVTVTLQKNTLTSFTAYYGTDAKGKPKKAKFPLALNWDAGDRSTKTIVFTTKVSAKIEPEKFLTLQLGSDAALRSVKPEICTVIVRDAVDPTMERTPYVRALAWPANGGKVSGSGTLKVKDGEIASTRTLTAKANKWATFKGWYRSCTNDFNTIDLENGFVTSERKLKVGKGMEYGRGTYFAYFTDVTDVASVNLPDIAAAKGVILDEGDYVGTVGVKFSLPVSFEDETDAGSMSVSGLPSGLKYDKKAGVITGVPTKACAKTVKCVAKNVAGKHTATFTFVIDEMPEMAIGSFYGVVSDREEGEPHRTGIGSVTFTAGKTGSLSAKVTTRLSGARSFSVKGYDRIDDNTLGVYMVNRSGETFEATLSLTNGLYDTVLDGEVSGGKFEENDEEGSFLAVRNAFLRRDKNEEAQKVLSDYLGAYEETLYTTNGVDEVGTVTYTVKADGNVTVKAKIDATLAEKAKTLSGSLPGGFLYDAASKRAGCGGAIRSGAFLWSTEVLFDALTDDITGAARYIRDAGDTDQKVGK